MNIELLRKIQKAIDKNPDRFYMDDWHHETACGTAHCIAGWAQVLRGEPERSGHIENLVAANRLIGCCGVPLFFEGQWPDEFRGGKFPEEKASLAIARIDHFIATNGAE
jgi:hypothetical protein